MSLESKDATCVGSLCERANSHGTRDFAGDTYLQAPFRNALFPGANLICSSYRLIFYPSSKSFLYLENYKIKCKTLKTKNIQQGMIFNSSLQLLQTVNHGTNLRKTNICKIYKIAMITIYLQCFENEKGKKFSNFFITWTIAVKIIKKEPLYNKIKFSIIERAYQFQLSLKIWARCTE